MNILALDFSTDQGSLACWGLSGLMAVQDVDGRGRRSQDIFPAVEQILEAAGWTFHDVDVFGVGRGPGAYTGLRVSLTAARAWALPLNRPVVTLASSLALAAEVMAEHPDSTPPVIVWGDARKGRMWAIPYARNEQGMICAVEELQSLPMDDRSRWPEAQWVGPERSPKAEWVARLIAGGYSSEGDLPIYTNPAVWLTPENK